MNAIGPFCRRLSLLAVLVSPAWQACGAAPAPGADEVAPAGALRLALDATGSQGGRYRLRAAELTILGPSPGVFASDDYLGEDDLELVLSAGSYTIEIGGPWFLEHVTESGAEPVEAFLISPVVQSFEIHDRVLSRVSFRMSLGSCPEQEPGTEPRSCRCGASEPDSDGDGAPDCDDPCPEDADDRCDEPPDTDGDGVEDEADQCPATPEGTVVDADGCSIAELCPCSGPRQGGRWRSHGEYAACVRQTVRSFLRDDLVTRAEARKIAESAARSNCGRRRRPGRR
jgi:hypothetical protein